MEGETFSYGDLTKTELEALAAERGLEVTRSDGERGDPLVSDYVAALTSHDEAESSPDDSGAGASSSAPAEGARPHTGAADPEFPAEGDRVKVELDDGQEHQAHLKYYRMGAVLVLRDGADTEVFVRASELELVARAEARVPSARAAPDRPDTGATAPAES